MKKKTHQTHSAGFVLCKRGATMTRFFTKKNVYIVLFLAMAILVGYYILPHAAPFIAAFFTALLLVPPVRFLQAKSQLTYKSSVLIVFIAFILLIAALLFFLTSKAITEGIRVIQDTPLYMEEINHIWDTFELDIIEASESLPASLKDALSQQGQHSLDILNTKLTGLLTIENVTNWVKAIPSFLVSLIVYTIALCLFMLELPRLAKNLFSMFTESTADKVMFMLSRLSSVLYGFLKAQFVVSVIIFIVSFIGLIFIKPHIAAVMSTIIWVIDFIPLIGSIVILAPWSLFELLTGDVTGGIQLAILAVILLIIRRTVEPKVMGEQIGLSPLATLISMYLGWKIIGIMGFIVGPLLVIFWTAARESGIIKGKITI
ncbi:MAG: sporulation integral membrane protein YtvI [Bacillus sp. (in: firmicutes)]